MVLIRSELWDGEFAWFLGLTSKKPEVVGEVTELLFMFYQVAGGATVCAYVHVCAHYLAACTDDISYIYQQCKNTPMVLECT